MITVFVQVYQWDLRTFSCSYKFVDDGCLAGTSVALSPQYLAAGSSSGVVNLYSLAALATGAARPRPERVLLNLTTGIEHLRFHPSGELLAMASTAKDNAMKLVHFPSMTVFTNFPARINLSRVNALGFSPGGGYMGLGTNKGSAHLYRLQQYKAY